MWQEDYQSGGLPVRRRRKYKRHEKRLLTIKENYEVGDYTLSELVKAFKRWLVKRRWLVVLEATRCTKIYGQQQLGKCLCVAGDNQHGAIFIVKLYLHKIFSHITVDVSNLQIGCN